ncbi:MAG: hypothetical protein E7057_03745 [Lentisphaerae bacterium]|nr:hypothetical protein [Lentisphaerota bacterium]
MGNNIPDIRENYFEPNYDPEKIAPYTLEDPLTFLDGRKVTNAAEWSERRKEILGIFASEMFGQEPPRPETVIVEKVEEKGDALAGFAVRSQYQMYFKADKSGPCINWLVLRPRHAAKPVPPILFLNYRGNRELIPDTEVLSPKMWNRATHSFELPETRGVMCDPNHDTVMPIGILLSAGFAVVTASYCEVSPDPDPDPYTKEERYRQNNFAYTGVFELWGKRDESRTDNPTALGAWAWALSRGVDLVEKLPELDAEKVIVTGCSRLGKAAAIAAARDERFAICVPVQCGGGGLTLAKRDFGENIATEVKMFTHWYCKAYSKYQRNPAKLLNFDQHLLAAAIAPRKLLIAGFDNQWFDTEGEYLVCKAASCAWEVCGKPGFPDVPYPADFETSAIGEYLGYYRRSEGHGIAAFDWWQLIQFASKK